MSHGTQGHPAPRTHGAAEAAERTAAIALWVVVGLALAYGVSETAVRVAALFT
ncbi:MFS transporter small subunit [Aquipuribacter hungaricus]|uniref:Uncharacterized protein n=1 Tax=Aquipuribacter hungaricus TaxID=545624 RepID=A0ABV7WJ10_9MICO